MNLRKEVPRSDTAEILLVLASFSIRVKMFEKARVYTSIGLQLFPHDTEMLELHAYSLLILGQHDEVVSLLKDVKTESKNLSFIRARVAMLTSASRERVADHLKDYLKQVG